MNDFIVELINYLLAGIGIAIGWLLQFFPDSPFKDPVRPPEGVNLGYIAWVIPMRSMLAHLSLLLTAAITYYSIRVAARWIKMIRN